ncbi:hypothetical protein SDRG_11862 [Saprolegnia diclina VS20]|uniref:Uncharacterized protein n=1 Tax=Saprolegnia diclina (strain VS20) TaxID=1156394 RepID=T0Q9W8_SAPDV|nr:hypothetical protein SDRG_11862 [Saprolegnia diclina VS20]EQC30285.1 hypothetical protein SDRG_11862 [Saprolegnia diclina VS20]|eukprot:XP_008616138.1 hypothetical protein SDRG_11862 [Saprolegnia diclina VS20]
MTEPTPDERFVLPAQDDAICSDDSSSSDEDDEEMAARRVQRLKRQLHKAMLRQEIARAEAETRVLNRLGYE